MRALAGLQRVGEHPIAVAGAQAGYRLVDFVAAGRTHMHGEAQQIGRLQPGIGHIVAIAHPGHGFASDGASVLDICKYVRQHLAGVELVGQPVYHRYPRVGREAFYFGLLERTDHHDIGHAADDFGAVLNRLCAPKLAVARSQVYHTAA